MKSKLIKNLLLGIVFVFISNNANAQIITTEVAKIPSNNSNLYAGIEIGVKAVKISVLELVNANRGVYNVIGAWNENTNVGTGISVNGLIAESDLDNTTQILQKSYQRILTEFNVNPKKVFVVISSGVAVAKNVKDLASFTETVIQKKPAIIEFNDEAKFLIKGSIPINNYEDAMVFDIGGGNAKGGIVTKLSENNKYFFIPVGLNFGTVTLTDKIKNTIKKKPTMSEYLSVSEKYNDTVYESISEIFKKNPLMQSRKNIYISGGTIWSFITLSKEKSNEKFVEFTIQDVRNYGLDLYLNYAKFEKLATVNKDRETVLKTYSQLYLISGNNILLDFLENIENIEQKKIYFVNQGYVSWLKSYILETVNERGKY
jgi:exopolyphosphatase/pppGpp-phosphohydrolase